MLNGSADNNARNSIIIERITARFLHQSSQINFIPYFSSFSKMSEQKVHPQQKSTFSSYLSIYNPQFNSKIIASLQSLLNSFSPEFRSRPLDDTVKFIFNREIWICYYFATSTGQKGELKKLGAEGVYRSLAIPLPMREERAWRRTERVLCYIFISYTIHLFGTRYMETKFKSFRPKDTIQVQDQAGKLLWKAT